MRGLLGIALVVSVIGPASPAGAATAVSDGFESGLGAWTRVVGGGGVASTTSTAARAGSAGLRLAESRARGSRAYVRRSLPPATRDVTVTALFRIRSEGRAHSNVPLFVLLGSSGRPVIRLYRQNATGGQVWLSWGGRYYRTSARIPLARWVRVALRLRIAPGAADLVQVTVGGRRAYSTSRANVTDSPTRTVQLGQEVARQAYAQDVDSIVVRTGGTVAGNATSPSLPTPTVDPAPAATADPAPAPTVDPTFAPTAPPTAPPTPAPAPTPGAPAATPATARSGEAMPLGDMVDSFDQKWHQVFTDDFTQDVPLGSWPSEVSSRWSAYPSTWHDTSGNGTYDCAKVCSQTGGLLDLYIHTVNGEHAVAAPVAKTPGSDPTKWGDNLYGRYAIRFRADALPGYKTAWLLWPASGVWPRDGEIDFPEGDLDGVIKAFMHRQDGSSGSDQDAYSTSATYPTWHTAVIEWLPNRLTFSLDGRVIGNSTSRIPKTPMHWVIQTETQLSGGAPAANVAGHVQIDWVAVYRPA